MLIPYNNQTNGKITMKEKTKYTLKTFFASLIKNESAIEGAKNAPWWIAIVLFVLGSFLPIIPIMVNASKTYGASFLSGNIYGYEQAITSCSVDLKTNGYKFEVIENELIGYKDDTALTNTWQPREGEELAADLTPIAHYDATVDGCTVRTFNVFYSSRPYSGKVDSVVSLISDIDAVKYVKLTNQVYDAETFPEVNAESGTYIPSYLILYKGGIYSKIYKAGTSTAATGSYVGSDWKNHQLVDNELLKTVLVVENVSPNVLDTNYVDGVLTNWKNVFNDSYKTQKVKTFWFSSGLYYGIYLVLGVFMGLMMFLLTRGKNNPNRNYTFWLTFKIACWIILSPAVLAMILGFVWSQAAGLGFIVLIGLRTMWLSMRQLNPQAQQPR